MKAILLGTDFMYNQNGDLIPIQINTAVGHNVNDRIEDDDYIFDLSPIKELIIKHDFETIFYVGGIIPFKNKLSDLCIDLGKSLSFFKLTPPSLTIPLIRDTDDVLIIRSAYDTSAIVDDTYCRNRTSFLNLISSLDFGSEFAYVNNDGELFNNIKTIPQNGIYPNFILKSTFPDYDRKVYPKLYKLKKLDEVELILNNLSVSYFLMPFYYNPEKLYDDSIINIRSLNILFAPDLISMTIGSYTKKTKRPITEYVFDDSIIIKNRDFFITTDDINIENVNKEYIKEKIITNDDILKMNNILTEMGKKIIETYS